MAVLPLIFAPLLAVGIVAAQTPLETRVADADAARRRQEGDVDPVQPKGEDPGSGLRFVGLLQARAVATNVVTTNPFLDGQVVGVLGGTNGTTVLSDKGLDLDGDGEVDDKLVGSRYVEQRALGFLSWAPGVFDGRVGLNAAFEIDFLWGDRSYGTGGNTGGGIGADQVNLQTRRLNASFRPRLGAGHDVELVAGLQFLGDGVANPGRASLDDLTRMGGGLRIWGTEAAGLAAYGRIHDSAGDKLRYRAGAFTLYENGVGLKDDAQLYVADVDVQADWRSHAGLHGWLLRDYSGGSGGVLGLGPTSQLSGLQGAPVLDLRTDPDGDPLSVDADLLWLAVDGGFNHRLDKGPLGASGLALWNLGKLYALGAEDVLVRGWMVDAELRLRVAPGAGSVLRVEGLAASRDGTGRDQYTGVLTGNSYGIVGAIWASHGMLLLFQDPAAVNRSAPVVFDVSNGGMGLLAVTGSAGIDVVPNRLTVQANAGHARDGEAQTLGTELGGRLTWQPVFGTHIGLAAAQVWGSRFDANPRTLMLSAESLLF